MLSIFRTNQDAANIFILLSILVFRLPFYVIYGDLATSSQGILAEWLFDSIGYNSLFSFILTTIFIFFTAFLLNDLVSSHKLMSKFNMLPGYFYGLTVSLIPYFLTSVPEHISNFFFLLALRELLLTYRQSNCADKIFNIGLFIGIASLFYFSYSIYVLLGLFGLNLMRAVNIKEILMVVLGFFVPYILLGTYLFWNDALNLLYENHLDPNFGWSGISLSIFSLWDWLITSIFGLIILFSLINYNRLALGRKMQDQKKIALFYWCLLLGFFSLFIQLNPGFDHFLLLGIPIALFLAFLFFRINRQLGEALNFLVIIGIFLLQYFFMGINT